MLNQRWMFKGTKYKNLGEIFLWQEKLNDPHLHLSVVAIKKEAFGSPLIAIAKFTIYIYIYVRIWH